MPYCSQTQFEAEFGPDELTRLTADRPGGFTSAQARADGEINEYLAARYALPLAYVPDSLVGLACDIARFRLYDDAPTDIVIERYKFAVSRLRDIAAGRSALVDGSGVPLPGPSTPAVGPAASTRTMVYGSAFESRYGLLDVYSNSGAS